MHPIPGQPDFSPHARALSAFHPEHTSAYAALTSVRKGPLTMLQTHVIDIDGAFVGAAVRLDIGYRFIATDMKLDDLDGSIWPNLADVQRLARRIYLGEAPGA
jgi:hypothetical protein